MSIQNKYWKILIADDQLDVHSVTELVLDGVTFDNGTLQTISAFSEKETKHIIDEHPDLCVILLDVVMETEQSGFNIIDYIRTTKKNNRIQIILRTGQPGSAPERAVIEKYDINDYKEKTELTSTKLYTSVISAIRSYNLITTVEEGRNGLRNIIEASKNIIESSSIRKLAEAVLQQIAILIRTPNSSIVARDSGGFHATSEAELVNFTIVYGTGEFHPFSGKKLTEAISDSDKELVRRCLHTGKTIFEDITYISSFKSPDGIHDIIFFRTNKKFTDLDKYFLNLFQSNFEITFRNVRLSEEIQHIQGDIIFKLGDIIEQRSGETGNHVRRVAEHTYLLTSLLDLSKEIAELYKLASTMHDVGKIGIPDAILLKPGKVTNEEFEQIKTHTTIGDHILKGTGKDIFDTAANIALYHHEQWDGKGYPTKKSQEDIPLEARIVSITDVFDALSHKRCYKDAWNKEEIITFFNEQCEKKFDPTICQIFTKNIDIFYDINDQFTDTS